MFEHQFNLMTTWQNQGEQLANSSMKYNPWCAGSGKTVCTFWAEAVRQNNDYVRQFVDSNFSILEQLVDTPETSSKPAAEESKQAANREAKPTKSESQPVAVVKTAVQKQTPAPVAAAPKKTAAKKATPVKTTAAPAKATTKKATPATTAAAKKRAPRASSTAKKTTTVKKTTPAAKKPAPVKEGPVTKKPAAKGASEQQTPAPKTAMTTPKTDSSGQVKA